MVFPEKLKAGDTIGLAAPAFPVSKEKRMPAPLCWNAWVTMWRWEGA